MASSKAPAVVADSKSVTHYVLILSNTNYDGLPIEEAERYRIPVNAVELKEYEVLFGKNEELKKKWVDEATLKLTEQKAVGKDSKKVGKYSPYEIWDVIRKGHPRISDWDACYRSIQKYKIDNTHNPFRVKATDKVWLFSTE